MLRDEGPAPFYRGAIARAIVEAARAQGGILSARDLSGYKVRWREPVQGSYRGSHDLRHAIALPRAASPRSRRSTSWKGYADLATMPAPLALHLIVEALKHAFADRARWLGDADFVQVPSKRLISKDYADTKRATIDPTRTQPPEAYGSTKPPKDDDGTTHVSVIDARGDMLACTLDGQHQLWLDGLRAALRDRAQQRDGRL